MVINVYIKRLARALIRAASIGIVFYSVVVVCVWLVSPYAVRSLGADFLSPLGVKLSEDSTVRLNLFTSKVNIKGAVSLNTGEQTLVVEQLEVAYGFLRLFSREIRIREVLLTDAQLSIELHKDDTTVGGVLLSRLSGREPDTNTSVPNDTALPFSVVVDTVSFKNVSFNLKTVAASHRVVLPWFSLTDTYFNNAGLRTKIAGRVELGEGGLLLTAQLSTDSEQDDVATLAAALKVSDLDLTVLRPYLGQGLVVESGLLDMDVTMGAQLSAAESKIVVGPSSLAVSKVQVTTGLQQFSLDALQLDVTSVTLEQTQQPSVLVYDASVAQVKSFGFKMTDVSPGALLPKVLVEALNVSGIEASLDGITVDQVSIYSPLLDIVLHPAPVEGKDTLAPAVDTEVAPVIPSDTAQDMLLANNNADDTSEVGSQEALMSLLLRELRLAAPGRINFEDQRQKNSFVMPLTLDVLDVENVDTANPGANTVFTVAGHEGDYFSFNIAGAAQPFAEKKSFNVEGEIKEFSLPKVNMYTKQFLAFSVDRGVLFSDFKMVADNNQLDGTLNLNLKGPVFTSVEEVDALSVVDQTSLPLNLALNYLKDKRGDIHLKIPVKGDLTSPDVSVRHIINIAMRKAAMKQVESYLIKTFIPYSNVLTVARVVGAEALKVRFKPLLFPVGETAITRDQHGYLSQMADLLRKKPTLRLNACSFALPSEAATLAEQRALAEARSESFKAYLVKQEGIASERLLLCAPKVDKRATASPRIEIGE